ncbi:MAG TPA: CoA transferase [Dehalococcoidia bacterium]|nr:CoA transferase [Dehalococcoidia bacterium]
MPEQALSDVRILDLTQYIAGPFCTKLLADFGADVIKIERPDGGDPARRLRPFFKDEAHQEKSGLFLYLNMNKRGITLNLKNALGVKIFKELVRQADVVVESFRPGVMARLGLDYETLEKLNPRLVMTSISNFGQTGPYRDYKSSELILYGMGGEMYSSGLPDREPVKNAETVSLYQVGAAAATGTMGALLGSRLQGIGQHVDMSMQEALTAAAPDRKSTVMIAYQFCGEIHPRFPGYETGYPYGAHPTADGYVEIFGGRAYWSRIVKMLGEPEILKDPKWLEPTAQANPALKEEFEALFLAWSMERTKRQVMEEGQAARAPVGAILTIDEVINDPHFNERGLFIEVDHPVVGKLKYPGRPFIMSETPFQARRPAPLLGQHNEEVYGELGYTGEEIARLREWGVI